ENPRAGDQNIGARFARDRGGAWINSSIHFDMKIQPVFGTKLSRSLYFGHHGVHEMLSTKTGVDRHHQQQIDLIKVWFHFFKGCRRADRQTAGCARSANAFQRGAYVVLRLDVDGDIVYVGSESRK